LQRTQSVVREVITFLDQSFFGPNLFERFESGFLTPWVGQYTCFGFDGALLFFPSADFHSLPSIDILTVAYARTSGYASFGAQQRNLI
jgi:hypothetical protein